MGNTNPASPTSLYRTTLLFNDNTTNYGFGFAQAQPGQLLDTPGTIREDIDAGGLGDRKFRFALLDSATSANIIAGAVVYFSKSNLPTANSFVPPIAQSAWVTSNLSSAGGGGNVAGGNAAAQENLVAGVSIGNVTKGNYGWFQIRGQHPAVQSAGSSVLIGQQVSAASTDGNVVLTAAGTAIPNTLIGVATANANTTSNLVPLDLNIIF